MRNKIFKVIAAVSLIIAVISLVCVLNLKQEIRNLNSGLEILKQENSHLESSIRSSVDAVLEEYSSIIAEASYDYEAFTFDRQNPDVKVKVQVLPKEYNPDVTRAYLVDENNKEYELAYTEGRYTGEITVPVFETLNISHVVLDAAGSMSTQLLNWHIAPEENVLPEMDIQYFGEIRKDNAKKGKVIFRPDINISIFDRYADSASDVRGADIVVMIGNREKDRMPLGKDESDEPLNLSVSESEKTYSIKQGETLEIYAEIRVDDFTVTRLIDAAAFDKEENSILNDRVSEYERTKNIIVEYGDKVIYDIRDEVFK